MLADFLLTSELAADILQMLTPGTQMLELGCGCGMVGIAVATALEASAENVASVENEPVEIVFTDCHDKALVNCIENCKSNNLEVKRTRTGLRCGAERVDCAPVRAQNAGRRCVAAVEKLDWSEIAVEEGANNETYNLPKSLRLRPGLQLLLGADLVYDPVAAKLLVTSVSTISALFVLFNVSAVPPQFLCMVHRRGWYEFGC